MDRCIGVDDMTPLLLSPPTAPSQRRNKCNDELSWQLVTRRFRIFQQMTLPYFRESMHGCWLLLGLLALALAQAGVTVKISYLNKDFYNVLVAREVAKFYVVLVKYLAAFLVGSPITVLYNYQRDQLAVHWREWMTTRTFGLYVANRAYYNIERNGDIDNPDQRISEDIKSFTSYSLELGITCLTSFIDLLSFSAILWTIYPVSLSCWAHSSHLGSLPENGLTFPDSSVLSNYLPLLWRMLGLALFSLPTLVVVSFISTLLNSTRKLIYAMRWYD